MSSPYISNGNYRYGITEYDQPSIPYYNASIYHKGDIREFPCKTIKDDGAPYIEYIAPNCCAKCKKCNGINRSIINTFVNIQSYIDKILVIKLYGITKDLDKTIKMKIGNKYCVTYLTEKGILTVNGIFKELSENTPDECLTYIGNFSNITSSAYIGLDCSSDGNSDKRLIYIGSIRDIKEIFDEDDDPYYSLSQEEKVIKAYSDIQTVVESLTVFMLENSNENENNTEDNSSSNELDTNGSTLLFPPPPPPIQKEGPYIVGARPPFFPPPPPPPQSIPIVINKKESLNNSEEILNKLQTIEGMLQSFISNYITENNNTEDDSCNCNDGD